MAVFPFVRARKNESGTRHANLDTQHLAIQGFDPVSYFQASGPKKGTKTYSYTYQGATYLFSHEANLITFRSDPARYEPLWGGWCGYAMAARGVKAPANPRCYKIINGRNVLFYRFIWLNARTFWDKRLAQVPESQLIDKGNDYWQRIITP
ncbi:MAG: YHS domain-containing (seleno)protein [Bacteroidia bacterium]|nr:YHS domain-containing (seleno)protein [Bacteroidia bacterium]